MKINGLRLDNIGRIVTIEDAAELQLKQDHVVTLESRPANIEGKGQITIRDLVVNSLRMRPDGTIKMENNNIDSPGKFIAKNINFNNNNLKIISGSGDLDDYFLDGPVKLIE